MGSVPFHGANIAIGAGVGRKHKDRLLLRLLQELQVPYQSTTANTHYADTIHPQCQVKNTFTQLQKQYRPDRDRHKTFREYAIEQLGLTNYRHFIICAGYTDYEQANIQDTLETYGFDDNYGTPFPILSIPWNQVLEALHQYITHAPHTHTTIHLNTKVTKIHPSPTLTAPPSDTHLPLYRVETSNHTYQAHTLILATTIDSIHRLLPGNPLYQEIRGQPFLRIYGQFTPECRPLLRTLCPTTTIVPGPLHKVIPIRPDEGIYMIVYTDNQGATQLQPHTKNTIKNRNLLAHLLEIALGSPQKLTLTDIRSFYWPIGTHYFTPPSTTTAPPRTRTDFLREAQRPFPYSHPHLYIVGEMVSNNQGWVEGALESVESVLSMISKSLTKI